MQLLAETIVNGLLIGGLYIVISLGFSLCYGVMDIVDFAVGELVMVGAFVAFFLQRATGWDPLLLMPFSFAVTFVIGYLLHPLIYKVTSGRRPMPVLMGLVFTFGVSTFLRGASLWWFGYNPRTITSHFGGSLDLGVTVPTLRLITFSVGLALTFAALYVLNRTRLGLAVRATAQDKGNANLQGVDIRRLTTGVYAAHAGLTGMAGALLGSMFTVTADMGIRYTIFAFFVVVLAGMGYVRGVIFASLLLGLVQALIGTYVGAQYTLLLLFAVLYLVLLVAPKGLFGKGI